MAGSVKRLYGPAAVTAGNVAVYNPPAAGAILTEILVTNVTGTAATITLAIGTTATPANCFLNGISVPASDTLRIPIYLPLLDADVINVIGGIASALNLTLSGVDLT